MRHHAWPDNGIHHNVPFAIYREDDVTPRDTMETVANKAVSKSMLVDFMDDPGTWKRGIQKERTAAMGFGSLVDTLLLEPDMFNKRYTTSPYSDFRKKEAQEWRAEMEQTGIEVITEDRLATAQDVVDNILYHKHAAKLIDGAKHQVAFRYQTGHGFASKGLVDIVPEDDSMLVDLKTCNASALESFRSLQRHIFDWAYHVQAGSYLDGWNIASGEERTRFLFIFAVSTPPHQVAVIELPLLAILLGADQYQHGLKRFAECLSRNVWPSRWDDVVKLDLPEYAYTETEQP